MAEASALEHAAESANRERLEDPNVVCVGYGLRFREGRPTWEVALQYYVHEKLPDEDAIARVGSTPVPGEFEGFGTDVIELQVAHPEQCPPDRGAPTGGRGGRQENPLVGGTSSTVLSGFHSFPTGYGTLGGICFDAPGGITGARGAAMAISNAHVWGMTTGADVIQPWLPIDEYVEAVVKLLACGPVESFILDTTVPSPLTGILAAGAAAAFAAAIASDAEDPSRWGQRVGAVPSPGVSTRSETVSIRTEIPERPFAGRRYSAKTEWAYGRDTTAGTTNRQITADRENEHVLHGKRVWTERLEYHGGERVRICAEVATTRADDPDDYFVVAHCFPTRDPDRVVHRVLRRGGCKPPRETKPTCFRGFSDPATPNQSATFPIREGRFALDGTRPGRYRGPWPPGGPDMLTILQLPPAPVRLLCPPCSLLEVELFHSARPVEVTVFNAAGDPVDRGATGVQQNQPEQIPLRAHEIVSAEITGGAGEGFLVGACAHPGLHRDDEYDKRHGIRRFAYTGVLDLDVGERADEWGLLLSVQTVDTSTVGTDPVDAAGNLGGITASANIADPVTCGVVMLLDHVFNVI
jgi:hypothetical protein